MRQLHRGSTRLGDAGLPWPDKYSRLAGRPITGGTEDGEINPFMTDIARGVTLIVKDGYS
jgi:hypothetical protein